MSDLMAFVALVCRPAGVLPKPTASALSVCHRSTASPFLCSSTGLVHARPLHHRPTRRTPVGMQMAAAPNLDEDDVNDDDDSAGDNEVNPPTLDADEEAGLGPADDADLVAFEQKAATAISDPIAMDILDTPQDDSTGLMDIGSSLLGGDLDEDDDELGDGQVEELQLPRELVNKAAIEDVRRRFRRHENDTGSPEYQIATLTTRINYLTVHLRSNRKDFSSTRGLLKLVGKRRRLLKYLKSEDPSRFEAILNGMSIRVSQELREM